jgi:hypothetical protein
MSTVQTIRPERVVLVKNPPEDKKELRGPVEIFYNGVSLGIYEICHEPLNYENCFSSVDMIDGAPTLAIYNIKMIEGL